MTTTITTPSGFTVELDEAALDNFRLVKLLREMESDPVAVADVVSFILGDEEERFLRHIEAQNGGRATNAAVQAELTAIFSGMNAKKK